MTKGLMRALVIVALALTLYLTAVTHAQVTVTPPSCWRYWVINASYFVIYNYGTQSYTIYVMTPSEYQVFSQGYTTEAIGEWVLNPQSSLAVFLPSYGEYYVPVTTSTPSCSQEPTLYLYMGNVNSSAPMGVPIGVSSFGPVSTNEVLGFFNITGISAYNPVGESKYGVPNSGASLQLNVVMEAELTDGTTQYYWLQDVIQFITDSNELRFVDNVWNFTAYPVGSLTNSTISGVGAVYISSDGRPYYAYATSNEPHSLPLAGYLLIKLVSLNPLEVQFCYSVIQSGGQYYPPNFNCYDTVTINTPEPVVSASIVALPNEETPSQYLLDAELVFVGYASGEYTTFNTLNAYLALLYRRGNAWVPYPNLYVNGWDTAEVATDLTSYAEPSGFVYVTTGSLPTGSTFLTQSLPQPQLPMTYVYYFNIATYESWGMYITAPTTITAPTVVSGGQGVEYVFTGFLVNGMPVSGNTVTLEPSNDFTTYTVQANYETYYLVTVVSPVPVTVATYNESTTTTAFSEWVPSGSVVSIYVHGTYTFNNYTRLVYLGGNESITVNNPMTVTLNDFERQYYVVINSPYPVTINGTVTTHYSEWLTQGTVLTIEPNTVFVNGVFLSEPGAIITVNAPTNTTIQWTINWTLTASLYLVILVIIVVAVVLVLRRRR